MNILNNFVNPWESGGAFGSQALGTEVLEGNVLEENTITTNNTTSYGNVYYTYNGDISMAILKKAVNYSKKLFEMNGIRWINFTFIKYEVI